MDLGLAEARWESVQALPEDDEYRLCVASNLAVAREEWRHDQDHADVLTLLEHILAVSRNKFGNSDEYTLHAMQNLGVFLTNHSNPAKALPLNIEAVEGFRRIVAAVAPVQLASNDITGVGDEHTIALAHAVNSLAALFSSISDWEKARPLYEEALAAQKRTLGENHPMTIESISGLGQCLVALGEMRQGLDLCQEAVTTARRVFGSDHPDTKHFEARLLDAQRIVEREAG